MTVELVGGPCDGMRLEPECEAPAYIEYERDGEVSRYRRAGVVDEAWIYQWESE